MFVKNILEMAGFFMSDEKIRTGYINKPEEEKPKPKFFKRRVLKIKTMHGIKRVGIKLYEKEKQAL